MFSSPSYAKWEKWDKDKDGNTLYVDFDTMRQHDGSVYFWWLADLLKPNSDGNFSGKSYIQGDCKLSRYKFLTVSAYTQPMGEGEPSVSTKVPTDWRYPIPNVPITTFLNAICKRMGIPSS